MSLTTLSPKTSPPVDTVAKTSSPPPSTLPSSVDIDAVIEAATSQADQLHAVPRDSRTQLYVGNLPYRVRWQDLKDLFRKAGTVLRADVSLGPDNRSRGYGTVLLASSEDAAKAIEMFNGFSWQTRTLEVRADRIPAELDLSNPFNALLFSKAHNSNSSAYPFIPPINGAFVNMEPTAAQKYIRAAAETQQALGLPVASPIPPSAVPSVNMSPTLNATVSGRTLFVGNLPFNCQWQDLKDLFRSAGQIVRADVALGQDGRSRGFGTVTFANDVDSAAAVAMFNGYEYNGRTLKVHHDKFTSGPSQDGATGSNTTSPRPGAGLLQNHSPPLSGYMSPMPQLPTADAHPTSSSRLGSGIPSPAPSFRSQPSHHQYQQQQQHHHHPGLGHAGSHHAGRYYPSPAGSFVGGVPSSVASSSPSPGPGPQSAIPYNLYPMQLHHFPSPQPHQPLRSSSLRHVQEVSGDGQADTDGGFASMESRLGQHSQLGEAASSETWRAILNGGDDDDAGAGSTTAAAADVQAELEEGQEGERNASAVAAEVLRSDSNSSSNAGTGVSDSKQGTATTARRKARPGVGGGGGLGSRAGPGYIALPNSSFTMPNPMSPLMTRGLPMTPSMPGFTFHPPLGTMSPPPVAHHLLSPGLGPFSPPMPYYTPAPHAHPSFLNLAPGAPLHPLPLVAGAQHSHSPLATPLPSPPIVQHPLNRHQPMAFHPHALGPPTPQAHPFSQEYFANAASMGLITPGATGPPPPGVVDGGYFGSMSMMLAQPADLPAQQAYQQGVAGGEPQDYFSAMPLASDSSPAADVSAHGGVPHATDSSAPLAELDSSSSRNEGQDEDDSSGVDSRVDPTSSAGTSVLSGEAKGLDIDGVRVAVLDEADEERDRIGDIEGASSTLATTPLGTALEGRSSDPTTPLTRAKSQSPAEYPYAMAAASGGGGTSSSGRPGVKREKSGLAERRMSWDLGGLNQRIGELSLRNVIKRGSAQRGSGQQ